MWSYRMILNLILIVRFSVSAKPDIKTVLFWEMADMGSTNMTQQLTLLKQSREVVRGGGSKRQNRLEDSDELDMKGQKDIIWTRMNVFHKGLRTKQYFKVELQ